MGTADLRSGGEFLPRDEFEAGRLAVGVLIDLADRRGCHNITAHTPHGIYRIAVTLISGKGEARHVADVSAAPRRR